MPKPPHSKERTRNIIKNIYLYLVAFVSLMMLVIGIGGLLNTGLKTYVFTQADNYYRPGLCEKAINPETGVMIETEEECRERQEEYQKQEIQNRVANRQRETVNNIVLILLGLPLLLVHWHFIRKEK